MCSIFIISHQRFCVVQQIYLQFPRLYLTTSTHQSAGRPVSRPDNPTVNPLSSSSTGKAAVSKVVSKTAVKRSGANLGFTTRRPTPGPSEGPPSSFVGHASSLVTVPRTSTFKVNAASEVSASNTFAKAAGAKAKVETVGAVDNLTRPKPKDWTQTRSICPMHRFSNR